MLIVVHFLCLFAKCIVPLKNQKPEKLSLNFYQNQKLKTGWTPHMVIIKDLVFMIEIGEFCAGRIWEIDQKPKQKNGSKKISGKKHKNENGNSQKSSVCKFER